MAETPIPPALSPALEPHEWLSRRIIGNGFDATRLDGDAVSFGGRVKNGELPYYVSGRECHALAALCLYGQPFGFSDEDVAALRDLVEHSVDLSVAQADALTSLASRIAALLPPTADDGTPP